MGQIIVDERGRAITPDNRFPVDVGGDITVENLTIPDGLETSLVDGDGDAVGTPENPLVTQLSGSKAAGESDQTGDGNGTATFGEPTRFVDVYNGGSGVLTITAGGVTRNVPPGPRLCEFPTPSDTFTIVADGPWVATANA